MSDSGHPYRHCHEESLIHGLLAEPLLFFLVSLSLSSPFQFIHSQWAFIFKDIFERSSLTHGKPRILAPAKSQRESRKASKKWGWPARIIKLRTRPMHMIDTFYPFHTSTYSTVLWATSLRASLHTGAGQQMAHKWQQQVVSIEDNCSSNIYANKHEVPICSKYSEDNVKRALGGCDGLESNQGSSPRTEHWCKMQNVITRSSSAKECCPVASRVGDAF